MKQSYDGEIEGNMVEFFPGASCQYGNGQFEAGDLIGLGEDDIYLKISRDGKDDVIAMRQDEAMAIISTLSTIIQRNLKTDFEEELEA